MIFFSNLLLRRCRKPFQSLSEKGHCHLSGLPVPANFLTFVLVSLVLLPKFAKAADCSPLLSSSPRGYGSIIRSSYIEDDPGVERLGQLLPALAQDPTIYSCGTGGLCQSNVIRLARRLIEIMPDLEPTDFNVLYITTTQRFESSREKPMGFIVNDPRFPFNSSAWQHHVVLEYRGYILDLDLTEFPVPVQTSLYFRRQFMGLTSMHPQLVDFRDLIVFSIRGEDYITLDKESGLIDIDSTLGQYIATQRGRQTRLINYF